MRATALAGVLIVWVVLRIVMRRRVLHPWFIALAIVTAGAALADVARLLTGAPAYVARVAAIGAAVCGVAVFAEGLRRESGGAPVSRRAALLVLAGIALTAFVIALLPVQRAAMVTGVVIAALLLNAIPQLLRARRRRIGSLTIVAGIVVYTLGRTAIVTAHITGADERAAVIIADLASAAVFGAALLILAVEDVREARAAAVGHGQTIA